MFTDPNTWFNTTLVPGNSAAVVMGNYTEGVFYTISEVYGMDLLVSLMIVMTFFQVMTFVYIVFGRNLRRFKK